MRLRWNRSQQELLHQTERKLQQGCQGFSWEGQEVAISFFQVLHNHLSEAGHTKRWHAFKIFEISCFSEWCLTHQHIILEHKADRFLVNNHLSILLRLEQLRDSLLFKSLIIIDDQFFKLLQHIRVNPLKHDQVHYWGLDYLLLRGDRSDEVRWGGRGDVSLLDYFQEGKGQVTAEVRETMGGSVSILRVLVQ